MLDKQYLEIHARRFNNTIDVIKSRKLIKTGDRVLSLGGASFFKDILLENFDVELVETETDLRYPLHFADSNFNLVLCLEVIEHIKDQESNSFDDLAQFNGSGIKNLINESERVLDKDGSLLISTPNLHCYKTLYNWIERKQLFTYEPHPRELSQEYLEKELKNKFNIVDCFYKNSWYGHGVPEKFVEKAKKILDVLDLDTENREEDNLFIVCKK